MAQTLEVAQKAPIIKHAGKLVTAAASTGAALVSIFSFLYSYGVIGHAESRQTIGNLGAAWAGVRPAADTASAIGDTLHFAATITDKNGAVLVGAKPTWTSEDPNVARVLADGSVVAMGPGRTNITLAVGGLIARSRVFVRQRVDSVVVDAGAEGAIVVPDGERAPLRALALDARGNQVRGRDATWRTDDSTVAAVDSAGAVTAHSPGRTIATATVDGISGYAAVTVLASAAAIAPVAGRAQRADAGARLPQPIVVRVTSRRGAPVNGVLVTFRPADGAAEPASVLTDADGRARTVWTLGDRPGRQTLLASVERVDSALAIVAEAEPVAANTRLTAAVDSLAGLAGHRLDAPIVVRVADSTGRPLADVPVSWTAFEGGSLDSADARTDSAGIARARWTLGARAGTQRLRVQAGSAHGRVPPLAIAALARAGMPTTFALTAGDAQRGAAGAPLAKPVTVRVLDATGNGVADIPLSLTASAGTLADSVVRTDAQGIARVRWTMGRVAGAHQLKIHGAGLRHPLQATALALPGPAANLSFDDGPSGAARAGTVRLVAVVSDEFGNPVPDARVRLATRSGSTSPARAVTDAKGRVAVTWRPGTSTGERTLTGTVTGSDARGTFVLPASPVPVVAPTAAHPRSTTKARRRG